MLVHDPLNRFGSSNDPHAALDPEEPSPLRSVRSMAASALCGAISGGLTYRLVSIRSCSSSLPGLASRSELR
jgi:hypothetical protein